MNEPEDFAAKEEARFTSDFQKEFPGVLIEALVHPSAHNFTRYWVKAFYKNGEDKRAFAVEEEAKTLKNPELRKEWLKEAFRLIRDDLERTA